MISMLVCGICSAQLHSCLVLVFLRLCALDSIRVLHEYNILPAFMTVYANLPAFFIVPPTSIMYHVFSPPPPLPPVSSFSNLFSSADSRPSSRALPSGNVLYDAPSNSVSPAEPAKRRSGAAGGQERKRGLDFLDTDM